MGENLESQSLEIEKKNVKANIHIPNRIQLLKLMLDITFLFENSSNTLCITKINIRRDFFNHCCTNSITFKKHKLLSTSNLEKIQNNLSSAKDNDKKLNVLNKYR